MVYGPLVGADDVTAAVKTTLALWTPAYVAEVSRQRDLEASALPRFRRFSIRRDEVLDPQVQLPACSIITTNASPVAHDGHGNIDATFITTVRVYAAAPGEEASQLLVQRLAVAVRGALVHNRSLGGLARDLRWAGEAYVEPVTDQQNRAFVAAAAVLFEVDVPRIVNRRAGPHEPPGDPTDPPDDVPTVATTNIDLDVLEES